MLDIEKIIKNLSFKRDEEGNLVLELEFKENQSPEETEAIKKFLLELTREDMKNDR